jgi:hypothetical protein
VVSVTLSSSAEYLENYREKIIPKKKRIKMNGNKPRATLRKP